jgi:hypothetical protein
MSSADDEFDCSEPRLFEECALNSDDVALSGDRICVAGRVRTSSPLLPDIYSSYG